MRAALSIALALALSATARAAFLDLGAGARAPGLGDAFTALADDAYAIHYNPAGLAQLERPQLSASYSRLYLGLSDGSDLGDSQMVYAQPLSRGKQGVLGLGWDRFALSGLYSEQTLTTSYGRRLWSGDSGSQFMGGLSLKYLTHSFSPGSEATNSLNGLQGGGGIDPVLAGPTSKSVPDIDLGFLYRFPRRFQAGLSILHAMQPNVAFSGTDQLQRQINAGLAYKSLWLSLMGEFKLIPSASGSLDRDVIFAAERYFPTLDYGQFGLRGSIGYGMDSSEWRQMTVGASYRINKIQFDYAFILPVGGIQGQSGSQRVDLTFHFGAPTTDEEIGRDLLAQAKRLRESGPDYGYEYGEQLQIQDLNDPRLAEIRRLIDARRYRAANKALDALIDRQPHNAALLRLSNRLQLVAGYYAELPDPKEKFDRVLIDALHSFLYGKDRVSMLQASYAYSLKSDDPLFGHFLEELEKAVGLKATRLQDRSRGFIDELLYEAEFANTRGDTPRVDSLLSDVLILEPQNVAALERLGSLRYLTGRLPEAIALWEAAAKVETRERELNSLHEYLKLAGERLAGKALPGEVSVSTTAASVPSQAPVVEPAPQPDAAPATPAPAPAAVAAPKGDPRDIADLYQKGVEHYLRGEYLQASALFLRILQIDPENQQAQKALDRIDRLRNTR